MVWDLDWLAGVGQGTWQEDLNAVQQAQQASPTTHTAATAPQDYYNQQAQQQGTDPDYERYQYLTTQTTGPLGADAQQFIRDYEAQQAQRYAIAQGPLLQPSYLQGDYQQAANVYDYAQDQATRQQAVSQAQDYLPGINPGPDLRQLALQPEYYGWDYEQPDIFKSAFESVANPVYEYVIDPINEQVFQPYIRDPVVNAFEQTGRAIGSGLAPANPSIPTARSPGAEFGADVGRTVAETVFPQNIQQAALEFIPGIGFIPDVRRAMTTGADTLGRQAIDEVTSSAGRLATRSLTQVPEYAPEISRLGDTAGLTVLGRGPTSAVQNAPEGLRLQGAAENQFGKELKPSTTGHVTLPDGTFEPATPEIVQQGVERVLSRQNDTLLSEMAAAITGADSLESATKAVLDVMERARTIGGVRLFRGVDRQMLTDALGNIANDLEIVISGGKPRVRLSPTRSNALAKAIAEEEDALAKAGKSSYYVPKGEAPEGQGGTPIEMLRGQDVGPPPGDTPPGLGRERMEFPEDARFRQSRMGLGDDVQLGLGDPVFGRGLGVPEQPLPPGRSTLFGESAMPLSEPAEGVIPRGADDPTALLRERMRAETSNLDPFAVSPETPSWVRQQRNQSNLWNAEEVSGPIARGQESRDFTRQAGKLEGLAWKPESGKSLWEQSLRVALEAIFLGPRLLQTGVVDLSYLGRQGVFGVRHPTKMGRNLRAGLRSAFDENYARLRMAEIQRTPYLAKSVDLTQLADPKVKLNAREEDFFSNFVKKIPIAGKYVFNPTERFATVFINGLRADMANQVARTMMRLKKDDAYMKEAMDAYGSLISAATGRGNVGPFEDYIPALNLLFYSLRRNVGLVQAPLYMFHRNPTVRKEAMLDFITFLGLGASTVAIAEAAGAEVGLPGTADFGKIRVGDTRVDLFAGYQQLANLVYRIGEGQYKHFGELTDDDWKVLENFLRSKLAPTPGMAWDAIAGENVVGQEFGDWNYWKNSLVPLAWQGIVEGLQEDGIKGAALGTLGILGPGVQSYPPNQTEKLTEFLNENPGSFIDPTTDQPITDGAHLDSAMRNQLRQSNPELFNEPTEESQMRDEQMADAWAAYQSSGEIGDYFGQVANIKSNYTSDFDYEPQGEWNKKVQAYFDESDKITNPTKKREFEEQFRAGLNTREAEAFDNILTTSGDPQYQMIKEARDYLRDAIDPVYDGFYQEVRRQAPDVLGQYETYFDALDAGGTARQIASNVVSPQMRNYFTTHPQNDALNYIMGSSDRVYTPEAAEAVKQWAEKNGVNLRPPNNPGGVPWY